MKRFKLKSLVLACSGAVLLSACGSGASQTKSNGTQPAINTNTPQKAVRIGSFGVVPTAEGTSGVHYLKVDNNTGSTLTLNNFQTTDASKRGFIDKVVNATSKLVGGKGYDPRIETAACSTLQPGASCLIGFNPDVTEGSFGLQLNYTDLKGVDYKAAQLIEYSPVIQDRDGFLVFNGSTPRISSDGHYSVAIPFVANDNYTKIELISRIKPISSSLDCSAGASKGQHCTAILTMPAGNYSNTVMVKGTTAAGRVRSFTASTLSDTNNNASLNITQGPLYIDASSGVAASNDLVIVNNGITPATGINPAKKLIDSTLGGDISMTKYTCDGATVASLPSSMAAGSQCTVTFTADGKETGADSYKVSYVGGAGVGLTSEITNIYWRGINLVTSKFNLSGKIDFRNTGTSTDGSSATTTVVHVTNDGQKELSNIRAVFDPTTISGLKVDTAASTCSTYADSSLAVGADCTYVLTYAPSAVVAETDVKFIVNADVTDGSVNPTPQRLDFALSATDSGNGVLISPFNTVGYHIFADGKDKRDTVLSIQNTSQNTPFTLSSVIAKNWTSNLQMVVLDPKIDPQGCVGLTSTDGTWTGGISIPASGYCNIHYTYGPTTEVEDGLALQEFSGSFGDQVFRLPLNTRYKADTKDIVVVESGVVETPTAPISFDPVTNTTEFELVYSNVAHVSYTYRGNIASGFIVKDSDVPYGFIPNKDKTTCPTTSLGSANGALNGSCNVVYDFMHQELSDSLFYSTVATNQEFETFPPSYQVIDTVAGTVHVVIPDRNTTATHIKPYSFANITSTDDPKTTTTTTQVNHTIHFHLGADYDRQGLLSGGNVTIQPDWEQNPLVSAVSGGSCVIAAGATSCDIELAVDKSLTGTFPLKFVAYSSTDSAYNAIKGVASIKLN